MTEVQAPNTRILKNGAVYDMDKKRIVSGATLSSAEASNLAKQKQEKKHAAIEAAANLIVQRAAAKSSDPAMKALAGDEMAYLKAVAMGRQQAAMDPDSPYGNGAATWITESAIDNAIELRYDPRTPQQKDWDTDAEEITATRKTDEPL